MKRTNGDSESSRSTSSFSTPADFLIFFQSGNGICGNRELSHNLYIFSLPSLSLERSEENKRRRSLLDPWLSKDLLNLLADVCSPSVSFSGLAIVDFTNPKACEWYVSKLEALIDMGVDSLKVSSFDLSIDVGRPSTTDDLNLFIFLV